MFYPSELLQRSGPLAHVWLAANAEKKLTKQQVLQDKIEQDINEIMRPQAPFSLRLSGSLMFGVVRIYSRKARYLLDDCTDALWRIKMAFKPGNIDLPANSHVANPAALMLADAITDIDLLAPMPDPSLLLSQSLDLQNLGLPNLGADWDMDSSQFLSGSIEQPRRAEPEILDDSDDLGLDLGEDFDVPLPLDEGTSIEIGRDAPAARPLEEEFGTELGGKGAELEEPEDLGLDMGDDLTEIPGRPDITITDTDVPMGGMTELGDFDEPIIPEEEPARERSASPLSELGEDEERALEQEVSVFQPAAEQEEEEEQHQARAKRRRVIQQDAQTQLSTTEIREQQNNREQILKPASFLPRDPLLMALMNMQKSGGFVSSILGDGRSQGWAPELRGILSLEVVSRPAQKRKRDSGVAATADEGRASAEPTPQLEFEEDQLIVEEGDGLGGDISIREDEEHIQLPEDEPGFIPQEEEEDVFSPIPDNFDDTTAPILHPADSGVVSLETKHAVHLLRQVFGDAAETSEEERRNTAPDIARMFNEILVLGTKDAIKVEQQTTDNELGGPIRIRAKRGLWGSWAETDVSGAEAIKSAAAAEAGPSVRDDTQTTATSAAPIPSAEIAVEA
ncbi:sister chromatid cohesion protein 1 [Didymosphaeria variabile]|uniref:Sister chromatid cohesion protein 1 n=1 Tax=Didymosphaeria variabile TaxID=1932322 RepID=A0A9W9C649_9PLEO|nr:sister chromatid cohesion protein 1 [Didymosphaeria variabile]KAJ4346521.1 sister chromatid cohesion protein 1 [Didymosphaeria variabile]